MQKIIHGDCLEVLRRATPNSIDAIITDPPYELGFMGKSWDSTGIANNVELWKECLRVLKPGGHLLAFSGTRTYHRMASAIEDAGFEVRDMIEWVYGSGFPKSLDIAKQIDKRGGKSVSWFGKWLREWREVNNIRQIEISKLFPSKTGGLTGCVANWELGLNMPTNEQFNLICKTFNLPFESLEEAEREVVGLQKKAMSGWNMDGTTQFKDRDITKGNSEWEGWGTALKPAHEPICMARKPLAEKTVAENCLKYGTGGINIDESRVEYNDGTTAEDIKRKYTGSNEGNDSVTNNFGVKEIKMTSESTLLGRFPANIIHDNSEEVRECFPETKTGKAIRSNSGGKTFGGENTKPVMEDLGYDDNGGNASRFFKSIVYVAKASKSERNRGCEELEEKANKFGNQSNGEDIGDGSVNDKFTTQPAKNFHPTVKPIALMEYLIKMVTREGQIVLDPFAGSGTTLLACKNLGRGYVGIEMEEEYIKIINARLGNTL